MTKNDIKDFYPIILDDEGEPVDVSFINDYTSMAAYIDGYVAHQHGEKVFDGTVAEWLEEANEIVVMYMDSWARLYYALSMQYNPIANVDGTTETIYGAEEKHLEYAKDKVTAINGKTKQTTTIADRANIDTAYSVAYDSNNEKETGKVNHDVDGGVDTVENDSVTNSNERDARTDKEKTLQHTVTENRLGNIGVTMTQQMLEAEYKFRQKNFFKAMAETIIKEAGIHYE